MDYVAEIRAMYLSLREACSVAEIRAPSPEEWAHLVSEALAAEAQRNDCPIERTQSD